MIKRKGRFRMGCKPNEGSTLSETDQGAHLDHFLQYGVREGREAREARTGSKIFYCKLQSNSHFAVGRSG